MKRILSFLLLMTACCFAAEAQVQTGMVKTLGRPGRPGAPLSGVTLRVQGAVNAVISDSQGQFSVPMAGKREGDALSIVAVRKQGYELQDPSFTGRQLVFSTRVPLLVVMVSQQQLAADKRRIEDNAARVAERNYQDGLKRLEQQRDSQLITTEQYRQELLSLEERYEKYLSLVGDMAERYARTDYDQLDSLDREINMAIEAGELDRADSLIHSVFDPLTVLERNRKAKAEIADRMRIAQAALDKAARDREAIQRDAAYAAQVARRYDLLATEYLAQGDAAHARDCLARSLEIKRLLYDEESDEVRQTKTKLEGLP